MKLQQLELQTGESTARIADFMSIIERNVDKLVVITAPPRLGSSTAVL